MTKRTKLYSAGNTTDIICTIYTAVQCGKADVGVGVVFGPPDPSSHAHLREGRQSKLKRSVLIKVELRTEESRDAKVTPFIYNHITAERYRRISVS